MEIIEIIGEMLFGNMWVKLLALFVVADTVFGFLRAIKQRSFNSSFGINGGIRKIAELLCLTFLVIFDTAVHINLVSAIPIEIRSRLGVQAVGTAGFFAIVFMMYEATSILKNLVLCGLPLGGLQKKIEAFLRKWTDELDKYPQVDNAEKKNE